MGAGYGFLRDAQNIAKQNRENLKSRTERRKNQNFKVAEPPKYKEASPEELDQFRRKLLKEKKREKWTRTLLLLSIIVIFGWALYHFLLT